MSPPGSGDLDVREVQSITQNACAVRRGGVPQRSRVRPFPPLTHYPRVRFNLYVDQNVFSPEKGKERLLSRPGLVWRGSSRSFMGDAASGIASW